SPRRSPRASGSRVCSARSRPGSPISRRSIASTCWRTYDVAGELLLDTGALVSLLDRSQARHREFLQFFVAWDGPVVSSEAVLTEATHLLARAPRGVETCIEFFLRGGATLVPSS